LLGIMTEFALTKCGGGEEGWEKTRATRGRENTNLSNRDQSDAVVDSLLATLANLKMSQDDFTSYKFAATLVDGSVIPLEGLSNFSRAFLEENYESSSESEYDL
jgi:hypothetical protein